MEPGLSFRNIFSNPNYYRTISLYTLHPTHRLSIFKNSPYRSRCKLRLNTPKHSRQQGIIIFFMPLSTYRSWVILWFLYNKKYLKHRCSNLYPCHSNRIYRICLTLGTDKILSRNCNYKSFISYPLCRKYNRSMSLRRLFCWQRNSNPPIRPPFFASLCHHCTSSNSLSISP